MASKAGSNGRRPYRPTRSGERGRQGGRGGRALALLSVEEKASLCLGADLWHTAAIERAGIASVMVADGPNGLRKQAKVDDLLEGVPATCLPTASALASSWDLALARRVGEALGQEAAAEGVGVVLGRGSTSSARHCAGAISSTLSEDPLLSGEMAAAMVEGIQSQGVGACLKHYAANNQETERVRVSADVDERGLREVYLAGFELAVRRAHPWMVMAAYNKLNGTYCSQDPWLLTEVLRQEWGFDGVVVSDWGAVDDRVEALKAGLDLEMPPNLGVSDAAIVAAVRSGELDEGIWTGRCPECSTWSAGRVGSPGRGPPMTWPPTINWPRRRRLQVPYCSATTGASCRSPRGHGGSGGRPGPYAALPGGR